MDTFEYVDTQNKLQSVQAPDAQTALKTAPNIAPTSGVVSAKALTQPTPKPELPQPKQSTTPEQFVGGMGDVITETQRQTDERIKQSREQSSDILNQIIGRDTVSGQDVFSTKFREAGGEDATAKLSDANTLLAQLQGKFRSMSERVSSGLGQSKVFESAQLTEVGRQEAVEVGNQALVVAALQGNVNTARQLALDTATFAVQDEKLKLENLVTQFEAADKFASRDEQTLLEREKQAVQVELDKIKEAEALARDAAISGVSSEELTKMNNLLAAKDYDGASQIARQGIATVKRDEINLDRAIKNATLREKNASIDAMGNVDATQFNAAIDAASSLVGAERAKTTKQAMVNAIKAGNFKSAYALMANNVSEQLTGDQGGKFDAARTDYEVLKGVRNAIQDYSDAGGSMNLLVGTEEQIKRNLGIDSGRASELAVQLWREFQTYRVNMTGAAFSPAESRDYASVNPTLGKTLNLNLSVIDGALNQLENRVTSTVNARVPDAQAIWDIANGTSESDYIETVDSSLNTSGGLLDDYLNDLFKK